MRHATFHIALLCAAAALPSFAQTPPPTDGGLLDTSAADNISALRHLRYESDDAADFVLHQGYALRLDTLRVGRDTLRVFPRFAIHQLTESQLFGRAERPGSFRVDALVDSRLQARHTDYTGMGYDRGHIVPAADFGESQHLKDETFLVTNIAPQTPRLNQGVWKRLEGAIRGLVSDSLATAHIVTGAVYGRLGSGSLVFRFRSERGVRVGVPSYFYKVVYLSHNGRSFLWAFWFTHAFDYADETLACFQVSLADIEAFSGETFFEKLPEKASLYGVVMEAKWLGGASCTN